jgi:hypothetical protein
MILLASKSHAWCEATCPLSNLRCLIVAFSANATHRNSTWSFNGEASIPKWAEVSGVLKDKDAS